MTVGTTDNPLRVAVIGSGPSGFYAAEALLKNKQGISVTVDMFERLITPHGLVRGGVAPDHQKIKSVTKVYDRIAKNENFRYFGNVTFGEDVKQSDLADHYHQVVYAVGAQTDKQLGIPGEELAGSHAATEFVAWYNGHPDYRHLTFDLSTETAVVIGNGNVAMDVTRILASSMDELRRTDIADYALDVLNESKIKRVVMLGRRGPAQAAYTNPELKELGHLEVAQPIIAPEDAAMDALSNALYDSTTDSSVKKNVDLVREYAAAPRDPNKPKEIVMRYLVSPIEFKGNSKLEEVVIVHNELYENERGVLRPRATDRTETFAAGLVFRSIGYRGVPLPDVPFYDRWGTIPNTDGRVTAEFEGDPVVGEYVVGWIKRGPSGIIGTNKPDSVATVTSMLADVAGGKTHTPTQTTPEAIVALLNARGVRYVTYDEWLKLDALELERGQAQGRPRVKFTEPDDMLKALDNA
jgi:ferredoxin--NADP+ reductase